MSDKLSHDKLPRPKHHAIDLEKIKSFDEASDYLLGAYHVCVDRIDKAQLAGQSDAWTTAAQSYIGAYMGLEGLKAIPNNGGLAKLRELIDSANKKADAATATAKNT